MKKVRFGIIGSGVIAHAFARDALNISLVELVAVTSRTLENATKFANEFLIPKVYESAEDMLQDDDIDAVYIATFHPTHSSYSIEALAAGKHVLCEKPAALSELQLQNVVNTAKSNGKLFMEALTVGFNPIYREAKLLIEDGVIGEVQAVHSFDGKISTKAHKHRPDQAGGALMDMGIYNAFLVSDLCGRPQSVWAEKRMNVWNVDGAVTFGTNHDDSIQTVSYCTMDSQTLNQAIIMGSEGSIILHKPWTAAKAFTLIDRDGVEKVYEVEDDLWLGHEIKAFAETILSGALENDIMPYEKSLNMIRLLDQVRAITDITFTGVE
ncbi:Gfo/Idh/MocA family protein [Culicoidibacter larvae]|uniref:Gfo/Idh/MocA family oxidoreductase n=1 Tax=Culicoidibacter larvae TaxID=2579976 RepID=A0A5R8QH77_9FIRM|nr:Gfo/Idh/MocA family oxidoreductase [Culicoidibacter larvae]TLG77086.1 Gfo/Idh/MocA family oxidoreductase [Culicoidibacter larvae]